MKCDKAQQTDTCPPPKHSDGSTSRHSYKRKRSSSSNSDNDTTYEPTYEPSKKKRRKKEKSSSPSSKTAHEKNTEKTNGYALKIRNKFLYTHLQSFLKLQKFVKNKLDIMKEALKNSSGDMLQCMNKVVPQFESMYAMTLKLEDFEQSSNEDELFSCITELLAIFPALIAGLSESLLMKVPGVSPLTIKSVLKRMEHLTIEMNKYSPQAKTLAYGNVNTGEATTVEPLLNSDYDSSAKSIPPPLLSLDQAMEMLDEHHQQQSSSNDSLECVTSLTVSININLLRRIGGKQLVMTLENSAHEESDNGSPGDQVQLDDTNVEIRDQATAASPEKLHDDDDDVFQSLDHNEPVDIVVHNQYHQGKETRVASPEKLHQSPANDEPVDIEVVRNQYHKDKETTNGNENSMTTSCNSESNGFADSSADENSNRTVNNSVSTSVASPSVPSITTTATTANQSTMTTVSSNSGTASVPSTAPPTYSASEPVQSLAPLTSNTAGIAVPSSAPPTSNTTGMPVPSSAPPTYSKSITGGFAPLLPNRPYIPTPIINISHSIDGLVVKWTLEQLDIHLASQVHSYCLCVFQGDTTPPAPDLWHTIGEVQAMKLPMACTLKYFEKGKIYHFAVRAVSRDGIRGQFSKSKIIKIY